MTTIAVKTQELEAMQQLFTTNVLLESLRQSVQSTALSAIQDTIEQALDEELTAHLGLARYERVPGGRTPEQQRSGFFPRMLDTSFGHIEDLHVPKLRRGNGDREWMILERYHRIWRPLLDQSLHDYMLGLSIRDLQESLFGTLGTVLSPNAVNRITRHVQEKVEQARLAPLSDVPPVILVDGVWVSVLYAQKETFIDQAGHKRHRQIRKEQVILTAMGIWPDGQHAVVHFRLEDEEGEAGWDRFWAELHAKGVTPSTTWLVASDGTNGLKPALAKWMPGVLRQRCTFHKIKNIKENLEYNNLDLDLTLPESKARRQARQQRKRAILEEAGTIYDVFDETVIRERAQVWRKNWEAVEPVAVRRFFNEFELTLNFLKRDFPVPRLIHTTNLLERFFEEFRRKEREIGCFPNSRSCLATFYVIASRQAVKHGPPQFAKTL